MDELQIAARKALEQIQNATTLDELKSVKADFMGSDSVLTNFSKNLKSLPNEEKAAAGKAIGQIRGDFGASFDSKFTEFENAAEQKQMLLESIDVSQSVKTTVSGARHPLVQLQEQIADFFISLGWSIEYGPEVEAEWFNFDALNFGPDHPARQMQDTFYLKGAKDFVASEKTNAETPEPESKSADNPLNMVLRTHTSPVQARTLLKKGVPVYIAAPGRVFRTDELDATHTPVFNQVEGLAIDKNLTMANLKGVLDAFAIQMFGEGAKTRLRPSYFPFTEPSAEMDVWYEGKQGGPGWIEWGGCGMVHPNVLKAAGVDPDIYSGFAFGIGIERTLMFRHSIQDMHDMVQGDVRFNRQWVRGGLYA